MQRGNEELSDVGGRAIAEGLKSSNSVIKVDLVSLGRIVVAIAAADVRGAGWNWHQRRCQAGDHPKSPGGPWDGQGHRRCRHMRILRL